MVITRRIHLRNYRISVYPKVRRIGKKTIIGGVVCQYPKDEYFGHEDEIAVRMIK